jgi:hypothetical protein
MQQAWGRQNIERNEENLFGTYREGKLSGRPRRRREEHTKTYLKEVGC